jgi:hypothetical protein
MQRDDNRVHSVEIVNVPPRKDDEVFNQVGVSAGATELDKNDMHRLFQGRNLAFISTYQKKMDHRISHQYGQIWKTI